MTYRDRDFNGKVNRIYRNQKIRSVRRGHNPPAYTLEELALWMSQQPNCKDLFAAWENSNFDTNLSPSIDRLRNEEGYTFDNIRLTTWKENRSKDVKNKVVLQFEDGVFKREFTSAKIASERTGTARNAIMLCCNLKRKTAGGYQWSYPEED